MNGKGKNCFRQSFRNPKNSEVSSLGVICLLAMERHRIVNGTVHTFGREGFQSLVSIIYAQHIQVVNMLATGRFLRTKNSPNVGERLIVSLRIRSPGFRPSPEMLQFDAQDGALYSIHPAVPTDD